MHPKVTTIDMKNNQAVHAGFNVMNDAGLFVNVSTFHTEEAAIEWAEVYLETSGRLSNRLKIFKVELVSIIKVMP